MHGAQGSGALQGDPSATTPAPPGPAQQGPPHQGQAGGAAQPKQQVELSSGFVEPFHPAALARRAMLDSAGARPSLLASHDALTLNWRQQQAQPELQQPQLWGAACGAYLGAGGRVHAAVGPPGAPVPWVQTMQAFHQQQQQQQKQQQQQHRGAQFLLHTAGQQQPQEQQQQSGAKLPLHMAGHLGPHGAAAAQWPLLQEPPAAACRPGLEEAQSPCAQVTQPPRLHQTGTAAAGGLGSGAPGGAPAAAGEGRAGTAQLESLDRSCRPNQQQPIMQPPSPPQQQQQAGAFALAHTRDGSGAEGASQGPRAVPGAQQAFPTAALNPPSQLLLQQQQQQQQLLYQHQLYQQQIQQQQVAAAIMYQQRQQKQQQQEQQKQLSSGTQVTSCAAPEPAPCFPDGRQLPAANLLGAAGLSGFVGGGPFPAGMYPLMHPYGAAVRPAAAFDPIAAWYMAHYGTPEGSTGMPFGGAGLPFNGFYPQSTAPVFASPSPHVMAQSAAQQHSVRQPAAGAGPGPAPQTAAQPPGDPRGGGAPPASVAVRWWQDPKMTFGPPGDPEFLATQAAQEQERPRPQRPPGENAAVAVTYSGPDSGSGEVTSKLRGPCSNETAGWDASIGGGMVPSNDAAAPDGRAAAEPASFGSGGRAKAARTGSGRFPGPHPAQGNGCGGTDEGGAAAAKGAYLQRMSLDEGRPLKRQALLPPTERAMHQHPWPTAARHEHRNDWSAAPGMLCGDTILGEPGERRSFQLAPIQQGGGGRSSPGPHVPDACVAPLDHSIAGQAEGAAGAGHSGGRLTSGQRLLAAQSGASTEPSEG